MQVHRLLLVALTMIGWCGPFVQARVAFRLAYAYPDVAVDMYIGEWRYFHSSS